MREYLGVTVPTNIIPVYKTLYRRTIERERERETLFPSFSIKSPREGL